MMSLWLFVLIQAPFFAQIFALVSICLCGMLRADKGCLLFGMLSVVSYLELSLDSLPDSLVFVFAISLSIGS